MAKPTEFFQITEQLLMYVDTLSEKFKNVKETKKGGDFYTEVKPFADEVKYINDKWKEEAQFWIEKKSPKNIHMQQIESVHEHIEAISVQAFFPETSLTRFNNVIASTRYVLQSIILRLEEEKRER